jgi:hypothetical protein
MWIVLWDKLEEGKSDLHLVHPLKTKAIASNKLKNDKLDAKRMCQIKGFFGQDKNASNKQDPIDPTQILH